jgi:sensor histidine kinase YesM
MGKKTIAEKNKKVIFFLTEKRYRILRHTMLIIGFIMLYLSARLIFDLGSDEQFCKNYGLYQALLPFVVFTGILYANIYLLMPVFFKGKYIQYLWLVITIIIIGLMIMQYVSETFLDPYRTVPKQKKLNTVVEYLAATIFIIPIVLATSTARLMQKWIRDRELISELDKLTVDMELTALKNQINPHFLFNMLNNVNMLVKRDPDKASIIIVKLSEFLRHQLYDNNSETTSLMAETEFLSNFLNLEKIRRDNFSFSITTNEINKSTAGILIPPNLFTTFVENAIKHSVDLSGNAAFVNITFTTENNRLLFICTNSQNPDEKFRDEKNSGVGMANINRRLELLYGNNYNCDTQNLDNSYNITLSIPYELHYS